MTLTALHERIEALAARLRQRAAQSDPTGQWDSVRELFTRDVTGEELRRLLEREPRESFEYFTRGVDFEALRSEPWYRRYPIGAWNAFLALAYRLSPARRVVFAAATAVIVLSWVLLVLVRSVGGELGAAGTLVLISGSLLLFLLIVELRDKLTLKGDLEIARDIQFGLLALRPFSFGELSIHSAMRPANTVGGDYLDVIELGEGRVALVVGDVAGKGMPAALLMALLQSSLRTLISAGLRSTTLIEKLNLHLCQTIPPNRLVTLFYGELDTAAARLLYVNAGHNPPFHVAAAGGVRRLPGTGVVLGVAPEEQFGTATVELASGDRLCLYTDGVTEAFDAADEEYGEERLRSFLQAHRDTPEDELIRAIQQDVLRHCGLSRPHDDMTLMLVGRR